MSTRDINSMVWLWGLSVGLLLGVILGVVFARRQHRQRDRAPGQRLQLGPGGDAPLPRQAVFGHEMRKAVE